MCCVLLQQRSNLRDVGAGQQPDHQLQGEEDGKPKVHPEEGAVAPLVVLRVHAPQVHGSAEAPGPSTHAGDLALKQLHASCCCCCTQLGVLVSCILFLFCM